VYLGRNSSLLKTNRFLTEIYAFFSCEFSLSLTDLHIHPREIFQIRVLVFFSSYIIKSSVISRRKQNFNYVFQINLQTRCNNFSSLLLSFKYSSTGFGRPHAHHQELNNCSSSLWFYRWSAVVTVLLVVVGPFGPTTTNSTATTTLQR